MSWDIRLVCYGLKDGDEGYFPRAILERAFEGLTDRTEPDAWRVCGSEAIILSHPVPEIRSFSVHKSPVPDHPFWPAIVEVLRATTSVLAWPGGDGCVAAAPAVLAHIPADWDEFVGSPIITTDPARIYRIWQEALARRAAEDAAAAAALDAWLTDYLRRTGCGA